MHKRDGDAERVTGVPPSGPERLLPPSYSTDWQPFSRGEEVRGVLPAPLVNGSFRPTKVSCMCDVHVNFTSRQKLQTEEKNDWNPSGQT